MARTMMLSHRQHTQFCMLGFMNSATKACRLLSPTSISGVARLAHNTCLFRYSIPTVLPATLVVTLQAVILTLVVKVDANAVPDGPC